jgi:hypothetical protein
MKASSDMGGRPPIVPLAPLRLQFRKLQLQDGYTLGDGKRIHAVTAARPSISVTGARPTRAMRKRGKEKWERSPEIL